MKKQNYHLIGLILGMLIVLVSGVAWAATDGTQVWWMLLLDHLLEAVVIIAVPVVSTLVVTLLNRWGLKVELEKIDAIVTKAVGFAEQKAKKALRDGLPRTASADKLDVALNFARDLSAKYKLSQKAIDKLSDLIEAKLGEEKQQPPPKL